MIQAPSLPVNNAVASDRASDRAFLGCCALLFIASAALTVFWCGRMSRMGGMPMPGGWTMSMMWMRMPGETWPQAAAPFIGMWAVMMVAMMLPSLAHILSRYRRAIGSADETRKGWLTTLVVVTYFFLWTLFGAAIYPLGIAVSAVEMRQPVLARAVPIAAAVVVLIAAAFQFTSLKVYHLGFCREAPGGALPADASTALRFGLDLGFHCIYCCASFTAVLLAIGVMDLRAMAFVTAAMILEGHAPGGKRVAWAVGVVLAGVGLFLLARAVWLA